jgi:DNA-binding response OmpR family regulator
MSTSQAKGQSPLDNEEMLLVLQQSLVKKRVLIVDRHSPARDSLRLMLGALGVTLVHGAGNSAEVIRQVKANRFDIVLSDFVLDDGRDGQQLLEELRHAHLIPLSTVYMIITSERGHTNVVALAELAPDDYLIKPFTADQLQIRLVRAIYKKHVLRRIYEQIEGGALQEAISACDRVIQQQPQFAYDALRFKGDLLHTLGKTHEAEQVFRRVLEGRTVPWARMGLATALRDRGALAEAENLAEQVIAEAPDYLSAYDFLASVHEAQGNLAAAQQTLQRAADASPHNTVRQRLVGDVAARNKDLMSAEKAYGKVIERSKGSSLRTVDDFANLSRVLVDRGDVSASRKISAEMKRELRGDKQAELAALVTESLCLKSEGAADKAQHLVDQALALQKAIKQEAAEKGQHVSQRLSVDLAHACYATGKDAEAAKIMRQVAAENHEDPNLIEHITNVFEATGQPGAGKAMLEQVGREIVELNNKGVMAARSGDLEGAVQLLIQAVEQVPNLQFLVNAAKAIYALMDQKGWNEALAAQALDYLQRAQRKDRKSAKVASARELYVMVAKKYGIVIDKI